jgi:hypothetical protein
MQATGNFAGLPPVKYPFRSTPVGSTSRIRGSGVRIQHVQYPAPAEGCPQLETIDALPQ